MRKLIIDQEKCIGCGVCNQICFAHHLSMNDNKKCQEEDSLCLECGQCATICPKEAITVERLKDAPATEMSALNSKIEPDNLKDFFKSRRSCRFFKDKKIDKDTFDQLITSATESSPSYWNIQTTEYAVLDDSFPEFKKHILDVYKNDLDKHDFFDLHGESVDKDDVLRLYDLHMKGEFPFDQFFFGGQQAIAVFAKHQYDAVIGMSYIELMAHAMGLGGFWNGFSITAANKYPDEMMKFFPSIDPDKKIYALYVIGYPKYTHKRIAPKSPVKITYM